jgi:hypothetical protein
MEQKDYLLREIEKIGLLLRAIIDSFFIKNENLSITIENHFEQTKEMLLSEIGFDLRKLLTLNETDTNIYLLQFKGMSSENIELLAETIAQLGFTEESDHKRLYFEKAIQLYELCERTDKTFSMNRKRKIEKIKRAL